MEPWYKVVTPREEVRKGRSFNPDEFAIHLEQVVAGNAPEDYKNPVKFFSRTCFTRALRDHAGIVLRRLAGKTENAAPVLTLVTQFGGGKTHTLTALYHLVKNPAKIARDERVQELLKESRLSELPKAKAAVFVGNAWDPERGAETPWIDIARQLAGDAGVAALGGAAKTTPPGTASLQKVFAAANAPVLVLLDEVLNFLNRHRAMADYFHSFIQNLTVAMTGTTHGAAMISLPRSQVEMTDWDMQWQDRIVKVVRRVAKDLIANDETEISEVIRRRLFEDLGSERIRKNVAGAYADWCFERRAQLPPEWTAVDTARTEAKAREFLRNRFEACYPFHPATLSVFQRKWQMLTQYQQTRGTLAMFAQWISGACKDGFQNARHEPLITLGSAPLEMSSFRAVILGQLGESRLGSAIETDIACDHSHARALDADTKGPLLDIHRRVGAAILFESSGGQTDRVAHLPELQFAIGEPEVDTTSIHTAALALESRAFFISRVGSDGFKIYHKATIRKAVSDRRASLDEEKEIKPTMASVVRKEFDRGATVSIIPFPADGAAVQDSPKLTLVVMDPDTEWSTGGTLRQQIGEWTKQRGKSLRLYPGALVWCLKKPGRDLRDHVELWLAWKRVAKEVAEGTLGEDYDRADRAEIAGKVSEAESEAKEEVWASYRFILLADSQEEDGLKGIDLGAGHSSGKETLCGRILAALKSEALLNESVGAGYIQRQWPPAFKQAGAWPLSSLRQSFIDGTLPRLVDPDAVLTSKIPEFISRGEFGLASGPKSDGTYERVWYKELVGPEEVAFDKGVFLLTKAKAEALGRGEAAKPLTERVVEPIPEPEPQPTPEISQKPEPGVEVRTRTFRLIGPVPAEVWNRFGRMFIPKMKSGGELKIGVDFSVTVAEDIARTMESDLRQALRDLGLEGQIRIEAE